MRMPEPGPFGDTFFDASVRAMVAAFFLNNPAGGCVESVLTVPTHLLCLFGGFVFMAFISEASE
jgi:hypothetical protein